MNLPNEISGVFNRNITLGVGTLKVYKDNILFLTFTQDDISVTDNYFTIDITNLFPDNGGYYINFTSGLFTSDLGEVYQGIDNDTDWTFEIIDGEYESTEYTTTEYLTD